MNDLKQYKELCEIWTEQWYQYNTDKQYYEGRTNGTIPNRAKGLEELFRKLLNANKDFLINRVSENRINESIDELCFIIDHVRSEGVINYQTQTNLKELLEIGQSLVDSKLNSQQNLQVSYILDTILDTYWHQTSKDNVSEEIRTFYANLCSSILNADNSNSLSDNSYFKHCIYFIMMSDHIFNDKQFIKIKNQLNRYIETLYGEDHHLSKRWKSRQNEIEHNQK
ncbi:MAG: hypothetical protein IPH57_18525 [Saprospiraceae bacterium]|nr:hypothetical protein [Saprospiraceae bacterium]